MATTAPDGKVTVIGAGRCGSAVAHRLAAAQMFGTVVLADVVAGRAEGRSLDIEHAGCIEGFATRTVGVTLPADGDGHQEIAGSRIVVIASGHSRRPGMDRAGLAEVNASVVARAAMGVHRYAPEAIVMVVTNPLDEMTALVQAVTGLPTERVIGQAGILDSARFRYAVATELGVGVGTVEALTLGPHSEDMTPLPSTCRVSGRPLPELLPPERIKALVERTRSGGTEIIELLRTGSTSVAPSAAIVTMIRAVMTDARATLPVCTLLRGEYGINDVYLGAPAILGTPGVAGVVETPLDREELQALRASAVPARAGQERMRELAERMLARRGGSEAIR